MNSCILVCSLSQGAGTYRAAQAIELAIRQLEPGAMVQHTDILQLDRPGFLRRSVKTGIKRAEKRGERDPHRFSYGYELLDQPGGKHRIPMNDRILLWPRRTLIRLALRFVNKSFMRLLLSEPWDCVISTIPLSTHIIASLRRQENWRIPNYMVTTDFMPHRSYVSRACDHYFTATEEGAAYLQTCGVAASAISVTGIPIHPNFAEVREGTSCLKSLGLTGDRPVLLLLAGGIGPVPGRMHSTENVFGAVLAVEVPLDIVVVTGDCQRLKRQLERIPVPAQHHVKLWGFTNRIDELMSVAEVVVTKPGGLTSAEVLARGAAMVIVNPLPGGPETRNGDFLLENGAAIKINNLATLPYKVTQLLSDPNRLALLRGNAKRLAKPQAAFAVAQRVLGWVKEAKKEEQGGAEFIHPQKKA